MYTSTWRQDGGGLENGSCTLFSLFSMTPLGNAKNVELSRCCVIENIKTNKKYELQNLYNEFKQY